MERPLNEEGKYYERVSRTKVGEGFKGFAVQEVADGDTVIWRQVVIRRAP